MVPPLRDAAYLLSDTISSIELFLYGYLNYNINLAGINNINSSSLNNINWSIATWWQCSIDNNQARYLHKSNKHHRQQYHSTGGHRIAMP